MQSLHSVLFCCVFECKNRSNAKALQETPSKTSNQVTWLVVHPTQQLVDDVFMQIPSISMLMGVQGLVERRNSPGVSDVSGIKKQNYSCLSETDSSESRAALNGSQSQTRVCVCVCVCEWLQCLHWPSSAFETCTRLRSRSNEALVIHGSARGS